LKYREVSEIRDGMRIDWDVPVAMEDGIVLRADVFRPVAEGRFPVILTCGPYGKWLHFEDGYRTAWKRMEEKQPSALAGSTNKYQSWEICDPEKWVPDGYACLRVDSRGAGRSPGTLDTWSPRETSRTASSSTASPGCFCRRSTRIERPGTTRCCLPWLRMMA